MDSCALRSLRPSSRFAGSCHTGASSEISLAVDGGEGTSAGGYEDGGLPFVNLSSSIFQTELGLLKDDALPVIIITTALQPKFFAFCFLLFTGLTIW